MARPIRKGMKRPVPVRRIQRPIADNLQKKTDELEQAQAEARQNRQRRVRVQGALRSKNDEISKIRGENEGLSRHNRRLTSLIAGADPKYYLKIPEFYKDLTYMMQYRIVEICPEIRECHDKLAEEVLRRGNRWVPDYTSKCPKCSAEWHGEEPLDRCLICDPPADDFFDKVLEMLEEDDLAIDLDTLLKTFASMGNNEDTVTEMITPNEQDYKRADEFFKQVNPLGQNLDQIDRMCLGDINTCDSMYYVPQWYYPIVDAEGVIHKASMQGLYRGNPVLIRKVVDAYNRLGGIWWTCVVHRDQVIERQKFVKGLVSTNFKQPTCPVCDRPMHDVHYVEMAHEAVAPEDVEWTQYYIENEVLDDHYWWPDGVHGRPPIVTLFVKGATLVHLDTYVYDTFRDRKLPQSLVWSKTSNPQAAMDRWDRMQDDIAGDPTKIPHFVIEADGSLGGSGAMGIIQGMPSLNEMEYLSYMDNIRKIIGNFYGIFYNSYARSSANPSASEGPDMQVDPKTLESFQAFLNKQHDKLTSLLGVTEWHYYKVPAEDRDVMKRLQIEQLEWQIAQAAKAVGFETIRNAAGELVQRKGPLDEMDISRLSEIVKQYIYLNGKIQEAKVQIDSGVGVGFQPNTERTPDGDRGKPDPKGLSKGIQGPGESSPSSTPMKPAKGGSVVNPAETRSAVTSPGTKHQNFDDKGRPMENKQAAGGADRGRETDPAGSMEQQAAELKRLIIALLMFARAKQRPRERVSTTTAFGV